jgi:hypothetical protein
MAEMGIPAIAASTSAPMYRLERITATGPLRVLRQPVPQRHAGSLRGLPHSWDCLSQPSDAVSLQMNRIRLA